MSVYRRTFSTNLPLACNYLAGDVDIFGNYDSGLLGVADYDQQLFTIPIRAPGTCEWLPLHSSFSAWLTSSSSDLLWLRGYAGVGKSVITKYLITSVIGSNYVRSMKNAIPKKIEVSHHKHFLVYFFCNEGNHALRSEQNILRSVLHQFLLGAPVEVAQALQIFKSVTSDFGDYKFLYSTSALWDAIKAVLVAISWKVTYLVFDALDEMPPEDLRSFASGLRDLIDTVSSHIMPRSLKILITSRPTSCIEQAMSPASISIKSERDVRHLIEDRAKDLSQRYDLPVHVRNQIVTQICEKAGGMFLWACLAWEELCRGATKQSQFLLNLRKAQDLPATLESLYESLLSRLDSESLQLSLEAFPWLIAATRPLHTNELRFAMALDAEGSYNTICSRMMSESGIKTLCPSLIYVNEKGYVQFAHSSIRDFLTHQKTPNRFRFDPLAIHEKLAVLCLRSLYLPGFNAEATLTYLCSRTIRTEEEMVDLAAQYYLLPYASANWHVHANALGKSLAVWMAFKKFLNQITSVRLWLLLCLYDDSLLAQQGWSLYDFDWFSTHPPPPAVHLAVFLKNTYLIEMLVQNGSNINELNTGRWNRTPKYRIPYLPEEGSVLHFKDLEFDVIKCLLRLGADVNIRDSRGQSPVKNAIGQRNEGLVTMLIESAQERSPHTPIKYDPEILYWAAAATMLSTIKMVLDDPSVDLCNRAFLRIDNSVLGKYMTSPLEHACLFGMESVARIMISHPRMIEAHLKKEQKFGGRNPTSLAFLTTMQGWSDLTLIAIQTFPVDLASERDFDMRTILHHASMEEWHDVLEICISQLSRSKLNIQDKNGMSALHYAAKTRNWYAVGRLLEAGASSHIEDNEGRTAGHVAAEAGSDRVLNLMLEKGAVVAGSLDHRKRTVLHYTATWNLTSIAERLIEADDGCVTARDHDGRTAAHLAALFGSTAVLSVLLATGLIDLNAPDNYGKTLLHCAVEGRVGSCIDELLWRDGIELNPLDRHLKSPLDVTASFKDESQAVAISDQLKEAGCRPGLWRPRRVYGQAADSQAPPIPACPPTKILAMQIVRYEPELPPT